MYSSRIPLDGCMQVLEGVYGPTGAPLQATYTVFLCMCLFEGCLGAYMALVGAVNAKEVPEHIRAAVYGTFRVPLNVLVVAIQLLCEDTTPTIRPARHPLHAGC